ncbi:MAG: hypothetical protein FJ215_09400 [Ignavibacteria bacterium]|nr:hypothetical protein [Ignavibacteria bacterium]
MKRLSDTVTTDAMRQFDREFADPEHRFKFVGSGALGGKAQGLAFIQNTLSSAFPSDRFPQIEVSIPSLAVLRTDVFDAFIERNKLLEVAMSDASDSFIAYRFQQAELPAEILGDLRAIVERVRTPLAVRSSSVLEDALYEPFAGVYATKMIPNNQHSADERFRKLAEAIKFVYASTYFKTAKEYVDATRNTIEEEKMGVIIQEVVGGRFNDRFYPPISGVARSFSYYRSGRSRPEEGMASLALGLGKTIVNGEPCWTYSLAHPRVPPPAASPAELVEQTQSTFWAVNMGKPPAYDPIAETEYLVNASLTEAEQDGTLRYAASTYDAHSDRISLGLGTQGPRVLTFDPLLVINEVPVNDLIKFLLALCEQATGSPVEIEFAMTFDPHRLGFLQVRPMVVATEYVQISPGEMQGGRVLVASETVQGNGVYDSIRDIVFVKPDAFQAKHSVRIAEELESVNRNIVTEGNTFVLIGFGRWGSQDPWLGVPVRWGQIAGARVIVEATLPAMVVELSQGSHFFHNLMSFRVSYFSVPHTGEFQIDWPWLDRQEIRQETQFIKHVRARKPLIVKVDGRTGRGVILTAERRKEEHCE